MDGNTQRQIFKLSSAGIELAITVVVGVIAGYYADRHFGTKPVLIMIGAFSGIVLGFYAMLKTLFSIKKSDSRDDGNQPGSGDA